MNCPNCGREFEGDRCPNCGTPAARTGGRIGAVVVVLFLTLPFALFGACSSLLVAGSVSGGFRPGSFALFGLFALGGFGTAIGGLLFARKLWRGE